MFSAQCKTIWILHYIFGLSQSVNMAKERALNAEHKGICIWSLLGSVHRATLSCWMWIVWKCGLEHSKCQIAVRIHLFVALVLFSPLLYIFKTDAFAWKSQFQVPYVVLIHCILIVSSAVAIFCGDQRISLRSVCVQSTRFLSLRRKAHIELELSLNLANKHIGETRWFLHSYY